MAQLHRVAVSVTYPTSRPRLSAPTLGPDSSTETSRLSAMLVGLRAFDVNRTTMIQVHLGHCQLFSTSPNVDSLLPTMTIVTLSGEWPPSDVVRLFAAHVAVHDISIADQPQLERFPVGYIGAHSG